MTDPLHRFQSDVDAALVRAREVAADAMRANAGFRRETRQLAELVRPDQSTDRSDGQPVGAHGSVAGFRNAHGRPIGEVTRGPLRTTGSGYGVHRVSDHDHVDDGIDDEDFSQARIMR